MGVLTASGLILLELRSFDRRRLRATETVVTSPLGRKLVERLPMAEEDEETLQRRKLALKKLLALRDSKFDKQPVLVEDGLFVGHCVPFCQYQRLYHPGQSRSIAFAMGYLIGVQRCSLADAWTRVKAARPTAHPNSGFVAQLQRYAGQCGVDDTLPSDLLA